MRRRGLSALLVLVLLAAAAVTGAWAAGGSAGGRIEAQPPPTPVPTIPAKLTLAGEKVPLELPFVAEQLDREFTIAVHDRAQVVMWLKRARRYFPYITRELRRAGMPEDLKYLAVAESALLHRISSRAGAVGMWQFLPATARRYGLRVNRWFDDRRNPEKATAAALAYLKDLKDEFGSWTLAMAAYNCGERRVRREIAEQGVRDYYHLYLPRETMRYVFRIMAAKIILQNPGRYGFVLPRENLYAPLPADKVSLRPSRALHLRLVARAAGTTVRELMDLNPELRSYWLPPGRLTLKVPRGKGAGLARRLASLGKSRPPGVRSRPPSAGRVVVVKPGDTLAAIARRYKVKLSQLRRANRISGSIIHPGQKLVIP